MLPVDRMRRFVTPVDIDGSGRALRWGVPWPAGDVGADALRAGRLRRLFPTPRRPGLISVDPGSGATPGAIVYPSANNDLFYTSGPNPANLTFPSYLPDVTNNPLHGFEAAKNPNLPGANGGYAPQGNGGMPADRERRRGDPGRLSDLRPQHPHQRAERGRRDEPLPARSIAGFPLRPPRSRMALPVAGRRRPFAVEPARRPGPDQLHQHHRRPTPSPAVRGRELGVEPVRLGQRQPPERVPVQQSIRADGQCQLRHGERRPGLVRGGAVPGPPRPQDQPQLSPAGLERPRRADPAEVDLRHVPAPQVGPAPPGRRYSGRAGPAQPVRDQHHRFPRPGLHDDPLAEPGRPARAGTARESLGKRADARDGPHAGPGLLQPGQRHPPGPVRHGV